MLKETYSMFKEILKWNGYKNIDDILGFIDELDLTDAVYDYFSDDVKLFKKEQEQEQEEESVSTEPTLEELEDMEYKIAKGFYYNNKI